MLVIVTAAHRAGAVHGLRALPVVGVMRASAGTLVMHVVVAAIAGLVMIVAAPGRAEAQLGALVSPGPLAKAHARLEGVEQLREVPRARPPGHRREVPGLPRAGRRSASRARSGVHRNVTHDCVTCHVEHAGVDGELRPFDSAKFNHAADAGFRARRQARAGRGQVRVVPQDAVVSHRQPDVRRPATPTCTRARLVPTASGATRPRSRLPRPPRTSTTAVTGFPLLGAHQAAACARCHVAGTSRA